MPDHRTLLLLCEQAYKSKGGYLKGWPCRAHVSDDGMGLGYAIYHRDKTNETVIAFRGTDQSKLNIFLLNLWSDIQIAIGKAPNTLQSAQNGVTSFRTSRTIQDKIIGIIKSGGNSNQLYLTGHSLGGLLAKLVGLYNIIIFDKNYRIVSFESPGFGPFTQLSEDVNIDFKKIARIKQQVTAYVNKPNSINTRGEQIGTLYYLENRSDSWQSTITHYLQCFKNEGLSLLILLALAQYAMNEKSFLYDITAILSSMLCYVLLNKNQDCAETSPMAVILSVLVLKGLGTAYRMYHQATKEHSIDELKNFSMIVPVSPKKQPQ